jgi:hypothetical protein
MRFKHDIATSTVGLAEIQQMRPVTFVYNGDTGAVGPQLGFVAEEMAQIDSRLTVYDKDNLPFSVRYENLTAVLAKAVQEIASISSTFKTALIAWLADANNGIESFFAKDIYATNLTADVGTFKQKVCIFKSDGTQVCITGDQLANIITGFGGSGGGSGSNSSSTPPVLSVTGDNPANINVGDTYADLGAVITAPAGDLNLEVFASVDGASSTALSGIIIDTAATGTHTIIYSAIDAAGLVGTASRTVNVN